MNRAACVSVDLDALGCYTAIHGLPAPDPAQPDPVLRRALPRMLEDFHHHRVRATLFCVGQDLRDPEIRELLRQAAVEGHELANHSWSHLYHLRSQPIEQMVQELARVEEALTPLCGQRPVGFRTPGYNLSPQLAELIRARGYLYDSSLLPSAPYYAAKGAVMLAGALRGQPSRSQMTLPWTLACPRRPYLADTGHPWRPARSPERALWEIPMAIAPGLRVPLIGTSLHLFGKSGFAAMVPALRRLYPRLFNLEFHAIDWVDHQDPGLPEALTGRQPDLRVKVQPKRGLYGAVFGQLRRAYDGQMWTLRQAMGLLRSRR